MFYNNILTNKTMTEKNTQCLPGFPVSWSYSCLWVCGLFNYIIHLQLLLWSLAVPLCPGILSRPKQQTWQNTHCRQSARNETHIQATFIYYYFQEICHFGLNLLTWEPLGPVSPTFPLRPTSPLQAHFIQLVTATMDTISPSMYITACAERSRKFSLTVM